MPSRPVLALAALPFALAALAAATPQAPAFLPVGEVRPGMVGVGRTVFAGDAIEEFRVHILGVLRNVVGARHDIILARLEGGPLATTGVIQGMSGSPVYVDGRLLGAVAYSIGSFPREPIAGITPIAEMTAAAARPGRRAPAGVAWTPEPGAAFAALRQLAERAAAPLGPLPRELGGAGPPFDAAATLRPIGAAMVMSGFDPRVGGELRAALAPLGSAGQAPARPAAAAGPALRPGDPVGLSLIRGDIEIGATGTVTLVDGATVYAFGHPFLNLGPIALAMTRAHVYTVLPSLDTSLKIAGLGPVIGTMTQDRSTTVAGTLGAPPGELTVTIAVTAGGDTPPPYTFQVVHDPMLTPLFSYVAVINALTAFERLAGPLTIAARGRVSFGADGVVEFDDAFTGATALTSAAAALTAPIGALAGNEFREVMPDRLDLRLDVSEGQRSATIERAWLDTTRPKAGATHTVHVLLRHFRGGVETVSVPVVMPAHATGPLTLLVSDGATLADLERRELRPSRPGSVADLVAEHNRARRGNRLYVRLLAPGAGTVVGREALPALPASVRSVLDADPSIATRAVPRAIVGAWEVRLERAVTGSRELTLTLTPAS